MAGEPTGQYARCAAFLYGFFTGEQLPVPADLGDGYHDAIGSDKLVAATPGRAALNKRWRVRDNMPGTRAFCPMIVRARAGAAALDLDVRALIHGLEVEFGTELLMGSAVWMTLRESRASFAIEGEAEKTDRIQRFADVLARRTGQGDRPPLDEAALAELQREILGLRTTVRRFGLRQSPVFVGEVVRYQDIVHYIAPAPEDLAAMLSGLQAFFDRTQGQSPVMRCAVAAFKAVGSGLELCTPRHSVSLTLAHPANAPRAAAHEHGTAAKIWFRAGICGQRCRFCGLAAPERLAHRRLPARTPPVCRGHRAKNRGLTPRLSPIPYTEVRRRARRIMSTATLTSKGQITIPVDVRRALNVEAGDRVEFVQVEPGRFEVVAATRSVRELKGRFGKPARAVSIEEMDAAIAAQAVRAR